MTTFEIDYAFRGRSQTTFTRFVFFFDHLPPSVYIFYGIKVYKKSIFLTTYPPPLVNVVCERPLRGLTKFWDHSGVWSQIPQKL